MIVGGKVINAVSDGQATVFINDGAGKVGKRVYPCGRADLVGDDAQLFTFTRKLQHREEKILSASGVDPTGPENQIAIGDVAHCLLTDKLGFSVNILR